MSLFFATCIFSGLIVLPFSTASAQSQHPTVNIDLLASRMGATGYVMSFALADIINRNHPWLRATAIETTGVTENVRTIVDTPSKKKNTIFFSAGPDNLMSEQAIKPYTKAYNGMRGIARFGAVGWFFLTLDPNIKTPRDFVNKRVELGPPGSIAFFPELILKYGYNVTSDKVKFTYSPPGPAANHLADKLVDVAFTVANIPPPDYSPAPAVIEVMSGKKLYFIGMGREAIEAMTKATGFQSLARYIIPVPPLSYGPTQTYSADTLAEYLAWYADSEMDEEIVFEITRTIYDNANKFADYHVLGKGLTKDTMASLHISEKEMHPGALKFYKEKKIEVK